MLQKRNRTEDIDLSISEPETISEVKETFKEKKILRIPLSLINIDKNIRESYDHDELVELAKSMKDYGQLQPCIVFEAENKYFLKIGHRRYQAALLGGIEYLDCIVERAFKNEKEMIVLQAIENEQRDNLTSQEQYKYLLRLKELGLSNTDIAMTLKKPKGWVSEHLTAASLYNADHDIFDRLPALPNSRDLYNTKNLTSEQLSNLVDKVVNKASDDSLSQAKKNSLFHEEMKKLNVKNDNESTDVSELPAEDSDIEESSFNPTNSLPSKDESFGIEDSFPNTIEIDNENINLLTFSGSLTLDKNNKTVIVSLNKFNNSELSSLLKSCIENYYKEKGFEIV